MALPLCVAHEKNLIFIMTYKCFSSFNYLSLNWKPLLPLSVFLCSTLVRCLRESAIVHIHDFYVLWALM